MQRFRPEETDTHAGQSVFPVILGTEGPSLCLLRPIWAGGDRIPSLLGGSDLCIESYYTKARLKQSCWFF